MADYFITYLDVRKLYLMIHAILFFGGVILFRSILLFLSTGINPLKSFFKPKKMTVGEEIFRLASISIGVITASFCFLPMTHKVLNPWNLVSDIRILSFGAILGLIGYGFVLVAQLQMGRSWRISIDNDKEIEFVQRGLFRYSRNPIYVGLIMCFFSYFLIIPSLVTLSIFVLMTYGIYRKVLDEETHLYKTYPATFKEYTSSVRRWL